MSPQPIDNSVDLTDQPTALVYVTRLPGNGVVAGFGWVQALAFSIPEALRRLAAELEKGETPNAKAPDAELASRLRDVSIDSLKRLGGIVCDELARRGVRIAELEKGGAR